MKSIVSNLCSLLLLLSFTSVTSQNIIPRPVSLKTLEGQFVVDASSGIQADKTNKELMAVAAYFGNYIKNISGLELSLNQKKGKSILLSITKDNELGTEGYLLSVSPSHITISANTSHGVFYGIQSLLQILPAVRTNAALLVPAMEVKDYPRFKWRGMMLDVGRHFFSPEFIKEFIDLLAMYKMNTFHWHLTEDQGWRIEIKKYPRLTQVGAFRRATTTGHNKGTDGEPYGGYYTQEQIKDIVKYASERHITIVPEIELPGHSSSAIAVYPELSCFPQESTQPGSASVWTGEVKGKQVQQSWGVFEDVYCPSEYTFKFIEDVMDEVIQLFPGSYIHIGGDECPKESWKRSEFCQQLIKEKNLKDEHGLQSYFIQRVEKYLNSKGKKMIGWDEILEGGLAPNATVMSWRGESGGIEAAKQKHDVVMSPGSPVYFDHYQGDPESEPEAIGGFNTLKKVYHYEPIPAELSAEDAKYVLGSQANLWTEYIPSVEQAEYMILPRMLALSEVVWTPTSQRNWIDFNKRLKLHFRIFEQRGLRFSQGNFKIDFKPQSQNGKLSVLLESERDELPIYYTTDGSTPNANSTAYTSPIEITKSMTIKAVLGAQLPSVKAPVVAQMFSMHKAVGYSVNYQNPNSRHYPAGGPSALTDGIRGTLDHSKFWHAFNQKDMIATIQFDSARPIHSISISAIQNFGAWIFLPSGVKFEVSEDGVNFMQVGDVSNQIQVSEKTNVIKDFNATFAERKIKAVRVTARSIGTCPVGHPGAGQPAWLFVDEIIVQ
ncbi:MAG: family 20 glycosylhydrolase [Cyclobacteriaceae bacterium]|nr:family 20 glycosylhydrolase [Cyclobacteriaceae bacterium]